MGSLLPRTLGSANVKALMGAVSALALAVGSRESMGDDRAGELRAILEFSVQANNSVDNLSCTSREYAPMDDGEFAWTSDAARQLVEKSPEGYALIGEYQVLIDRSGRRMKYIGREFLVGSDDRRTPYYKNFNAAYDGDLYRTYGGIRNTGQQVLYRDELDCRRSIHSFLGDNIGGARVVGAELSYWMSNPDGWAFESGPDALSPQIVRRYRTTTFASEMRLHVTLSPDHDYLPSHIETYWRETETVYQQYRIEKFHRVEPAGIWVPVRGWYQGFYREPVFPEGVDEQTYSKMSPAEKENVDPLVRWVAHRISEPRLIVVDAASIKLNERLRDDDFVLQFPADCKVFDERTQQALLGGVTPVPPKGRAWSGAAVRWVPLVVVNAAIVLVLWLLHRRARRKGASARGD